MAALHGATRLTHRTSFSLHTAHPSGAAGLQILIGPYLNASDYATDTCGRTCFQNYQNATHAFYASCRSQLNASYVPLATAISNFQEYRNQACGASLRICAVSALLYLPNRRIV
jgi:hypothetical protein